MLKPLLLTLCLFGGAFTDTFGNEITPDKSNTQNTQNTDRSRHFIIGNTEQQSSKQVIRLAKDILTRVYKELGISVEYRGMPTRRALDLANKGLFDADILRFSNVVDAVEYSNLIPVEPPFLKAHVFLVCVKQQTCEQNRPLRIGFIEYYLSIQHYCDTNQLQCLPIKIETLGFKELDKNLINAMLLTVAEIQELTLMAPARTLYVRNVKKLNIPVYHYINKKHAAMLPVLSVALSKVLQSSQFKQTSQQVIEDMLNQPSIALMADY